MPAPSFGSLATGSRAMPPEPTGASPGDPPPNKLRVLVVGGSVAGVRAAQQLWVCLVGLLG